MNNGRHDFTVNRNRIDIPLVDLRKQYQSIKKSVDRAIEKVFLKSEFVLGEELECFEREFAEYCTVKYAVGVDSGTSALELSLRVLGIGPGDGVIVPTFTYYSTASSVCYTGAIPVFMDIEEKTGNIDAIALDKYLKKNVLNRDCKIKAIIPVHIYGQPADMKKIMNIAKEHDLRVIEDACQAHGGKYIWRKSGKKFTKKMVGSIGDTGCFSFYPAKNLGAYGDGGMIITNNSTIFHKLRLLRDSARVNKYYHIGIGYTKRLDTLQAAILRVKLKRLEGWNQLRKKHAALYERLLKGSGFVPLEIAEYAQPVYHMYVLRTKNRDALRKHLAENGIETGIHYPLPLHLQPAYEFLGYKMGDLPVSEKLSQEVISLPMYPELTVKEIKAVVKCMTIFSKKTPYSLGANCPAVARGNSLYQSSTYRKR
jgi:dTDP-4-amino-4,6-dideoxygalactose transaminase